MRRGLAVDQRAAARDGSSRRDQISLDGVHAPSGSRQKLYGRGWRAVCHVVASALQTSGSSTWHQAVSASSTGQSLADRARGRR